MNQNKTFYVWCDWESTGIWVADEKDPHLKNADYQKYHLPQELITRFQYWERWFSDAMPEWNNERNKTDQKLYDAYGLSLAIDLKRFVGDKNRVVYGSPTYVDGKPTYNECTEIILVEREFSETAVTKIVPISVPYKK